jgi:hypothetical protein
VPSQNGFFVDAPQRQSTVLVWVGKRFPFVSRSSIEPLTMYGPFGLASIVTSAMSDLPVIFPKVKSLTRLPAGDGPGKSPRLIAIGDARENSAQLNGDRQLAALVEGSADRDRISVGDDKHPGSMRARMVAGKHVVPPPPPSSPRRGVVVSFTASSARTRIAFRVGAQTFDGDQL